MSANRRQFNRFTTLSTVTGEREVIDRDGRCVAVRDDRRSASGTAHRLNCAAADGPRSLAKALGGLR